MRRIEIGSSIDSVALLPDGRGVVALVRRSRALGWDTPSGISSAGTIMGASSYGHTGFTGTSIWVDPGRETVIVLLTNRVHPTRNTPAFGLIRGTVADAVMRAAFPGSPPRAATPP